MGQVYAARSGDGELVALKQLALIEPTLLYRFKREFRSLADLRHPNLVVLGELVVLASGLAFFTMELVEGQAFVRWVRLATPAGTAPNFHRVCHAFRQLADAVAYLHHGGRLHRDLKPSNVHVTSEGRVVVLDFGLVFELSDDDARITATGQLVGTPAYMAPEQGSHRAMGPAVDLYAIGVMLFECLTGCMPFVGSTVRVLIDKQHEAAPDPRELAEGIPDWLAQLCRALLDVDPSHRPSAAQILATIDEHGEAGSLRMVADDARGPQLFGRERELETLERAFAQVEDVGVAAVVRLTGPPGRGKTALVERFLESVRASEAVVLRGRCHLRESVPFKGVDGVVDALGRHLRSLPPVEAAALRPRHCRELSALFPVLGGIWPDASRRVIEREPVMRRRAGIEALREVLARITDSAPLVLAIDDFQWADLDSLGVLRELLLPPSPPAMLLVLAFDAGADAPVGAAIRERDALRGAELVDLDLAPLDSNAAEQLARSLLEPGCDGAEVDASVRELVEGCGGEPFALVRKATARESDAGALSADVDLLRRLKNLAPEARMLLELATVAGVPLANELARATLDSELTSFDDSTRELVAAGLLGTVAVEARGLIRLAIPRIAELVRIELDAARTVWLHLRLAEALAEAGADAELISNHFARANKHERARSHMVAAAVQAADALAFVRAEQLYRCALELLPSSLDAEFADERRALQMALADQLVNLSRSPEAAELYVEVARHSRPEQAAALRLQAATQYANAGWTEFALPILRELMHEAGERLPTTPIELVLTFAWNQLRLLWRGQRATLRHADEIPTSELARFDLVYATTMTLSKRAMLLALAVLPRTAHLGLTTGDPMRLLRAIAMETSLLITIGRFAKAAQNIERARAICQTLPDSPAALYIDVLQIFLFAARADLDAATVSYERALEGAERHPAEGWILASVLHNYTLLLRRAGRYQQVEQLLPGWISLLHDLGHRQFETLLLGEEVIVLAQVGDRSLARRSLERAKAGWSLDEYTFVDYLLNLAEVWLLLAEGRPAAAHPLSEQTRQDLRTHGLARFKLPRVRMNETCAYAALAHAIAQDDPKLAPSPRDLRRLRRSGLPKFSTAARILAAGRASLRGEVERERALWRESLEHCEAHSLRGLAAVVRRRLVELRVEDAATLGAEAQAYFVEQAIDDVERFVSLLAPARRLG